MRTPSEPAPLAGRLARFALVFLLVAHGTSLSRPCSAAEPKDETTMDERTRVRAAALFEEGKRFYDVGDYAQAIVRFEQAYAMSGVPTLLLNLAQAHRLSGPSHCELALALYKRFLTRKPETVHRQEVEQRIAELQKCPAGAIPSRPAEGSAPELPPPVEAAEPSGPSETTGADATKRWRMVGWSGVGLGVLGAGVAAVSTTLALTRQADLLDACRGDGRCPPSERQRVEDYESIRTLAIAGAITGGVGVAAAIIGFWSAARNDHRVPVSQHRGTDFWCSPSWIGLRGAF